MEDHELLSWKFWTKLNISGDLQKFSSLLVIFICCVALQIRNSSPKLLKIGKLNERNLS